MYNKEFAVMKKYSHHSNNTNKPSFWPKKRGQRLSVVQKRLEFHTMSIFSTNPICCLRHHPYSG